MSEMELLIANRKSCSLVRKNQTTDKTVSYSKILNNYVENSGFPNFMEIT